MYDFIYFLESSFTVSVLLHCYVTFSGISFIDAIRNRLYIYHYHYRSGIHVLTNYAQYRMNEWL